MTHDHDQGLQHDLAIIRRRAALASIAGGATLLGGCSRASALAASACAASPSETRGPYPADGTRGWSGDVPNVLEHAGILRSDIRSSLDSRAAAPGVPVRLTFALVDAGTGCTPLAGHVVYLWQCDRDGCYSLYDLPEQSWLRGAQVTDVRGEATFTTIFPAAYVGRYPHMHFELFRTVADANDGRRAALVSQLLMPAAACNSVYQNAPGYERSRTSFPSMSTGSDSVTRDNNAADIAAMTPLFTADRNGFSARAIVGIA